MDRERFDPDDIRKSDMNKLATAIEAYLDELWETMVIPEEYQNDYGDQIHEGFKRCRQLVKKLRKGDISVFKEADEWNSLGE